MNDCWTRFIKGLNTDGLIKPRSGVMQASSSWSILWTVIHHFFHSAATNRSKPWPGMPMADPGRGVDRKRTREQQRERGEIFVPTGTCMHWSRAITLWKGQSPQQAVLWHQARTTPGHSHLWLPQHQVQQYVPGIYASGSLFSKATWENFSSPPWTSTCRAPKGSKSMPASITSWTSRIPRQTESSFQLQVTEEEPKFRERGWSVFARGHTNCESRSWLSSPDLASDPRLTSPQPQVTPTIGGRRAAAVTNPAGHPAPLPSLCRPGLEPCLAQGTSRSPHQLCGVGG